MTDRLPVLDAVGEVKPATGLYGPGDYPDDFVPIGNLWNRSPEAQRRFAVSHALVDLAHDLDARGLVLVPEVATPDMRIRGAVEMNAHRLHGSKFKAGAPDIWASMVKEGVTEFPPLPPPIDTADADLETGGE